VDTLIYLHPEEQRFCSIDGRWSDFSEQFCEEKSDNLDANIV
jgi:hypothetical protein